MIEAVVPDESGEKDFRVDIVLEVTPPGKDSNVEDLWSNLKEKQVTQQENEEVPPSLKEAAPDDIQLGHEDELVGGTFKTPEVQTNQGTTTQPSNVEDSPVLEDQQSVEGSVEDVNDAASPVQLFSTPMLQDGLVVGFVLTLNAPLAASDRIVVQEDGNVEPLVQLRKQAFPVDEVDFAAGSGKKYRLLIKKCDGEAAGQTVQFNDKELQFEVRPGKDVTLHVLDQGGHPVDLQGEVDLHVRFSNEGRVDPVKATKERCDSLASHPKFAGNKDQMNGHVFRAWKASRGDGQYYEDEEGVKKIKLVLNGSNKIFLNFPCLTSEVATNQMWDLVVSVGGKVLSAQIQVLQVLRKPTIRAKRTKACPEIEEPSKKIVKMN